jgi:hypothetical protein
MPAVEFGCVWGDVFWLEAKSGRAYQGRLDQQLREPQLFEGADYHRPTTAAGWVTFEVRDADAKGLAPLHVPRNLRVVRDTCGDPAQVTTRRGASATRARSRAPLSSHRLETRASVAR